MQTPLHPSEDPKPPPLPDLLYEPLSLHSVEPKKEDPDATAIVAAARDAGTIELSRRPRGRPRGSKNKPKPPIIIETQSPCAMRAHVFEVPAGHDISACLARFSRVKNLGLCVLAGTGDVANVTLRQPGDAENTFSFLGRFDILSISATILPPSPAAAEAAVGGGGFTITLAGPQGSVVGGRVAGPLVAAGKVVLMAAVFTEPTFHLLPVDNVPITVSGDSDGAAEHEHQQMAAPESCAMTVYSCHVPSDVIWAPTASRPPPPPPY